MCLKDRAIYLNNQQQQANEAIYSSSSQAIANPFGLAYSSHSPSVSHSSAAQSLSASPHSYHRDDDTTDHNQHQHNKNHPVLDSDEDEEENNQNDLINDEEDEESLEDSSLLDTADITTSNAAAVAAAVAAVTSSSSSGVSESQFQTPYFPPPYNPVLNQFEFNNPQMASAADLASKLILRLSLNL